MAIREMRLQASPNFLIANKKFSNFVGNTPSAHANAPPGSYKAVPPSGGGAVGVEQFVHELCTFGARNAAAAAVHYSKTIKLVQKRLLQIHILKMDCWVH